MDDGAKVWVLADDRPGNTTQSLGLAEALGWPYEVQQLRFNLLSRLHNRFLGASRAGVARTTARRLVPPWPDVVIAAGRRTAPVARWIGKQSRGRTRLVQLGRKGGDVADPFDVVVTPSHCRLAPHPRRIETAVPLTRVSPHRLTRAAEQWHDLFEGEPHPRVALLVGGSTRRFELDSRTARRMGERVRAATEEAGGKVFAITSRRTGSAATAALRAALGEGHSLHTWSANTKDNPYLAYLALADVLVVTGESESMLAEAAGTGNPLFIYPLPERAPGPLLQLGDWVAARAESQRSDRRGAGKLRHGLGRLCVRLIEHGIVRPPRDMALLHRALVEAGAARIFDGSVQGGAHVPLREMEKVARRVRQLLATT